MTRYSCVLCEMWAEDEETVQHRACGRMSRFSWRKNKAPSDETVRDKTRECDNSALNDKHCVNTLQIRLIAIIIKVATAGVKCPSLLQTNNNFSAEYYSTSTNVLQFADRDSAVHEHQAK